MAKKSTLTLFRITLTPIANPNGCQVFSLVWAKNEDTAMEVALRKYEGMEVYNSEIV